jgi:hypothetical protein
LKFRAFSRKARKASILSLIISSNWLQ